MSKQICELIKEFEEGDLYAVSGRPIMGKTTTCMHIANAFSNCGRTVLYIETYGTVLNERNLDVISQCDFIFQPGISIDKIESLIITGRYNVVIIDDFQRMKHKKKKKSVKRLEHIAKQYGVTVIVASNIWRGAERRKSHKPKVTDMKRRMCGNLAYRCKAVVLLYRSKYYDDDEAQDIMEFTVVRGFFRKKKVIMADFSKIIWDLYGEEGFSL